MATDTDICNIALANLGHAAKVSSIDPVDGSVEAMHCARFYPVARGLALSKHDWGFATRRAKLSELVVDETTYSDYQYAYALPAGFLRFIGFVDDTGLLIRSGGWDYQIESNDSGTKILLTDCDPAGAYVRYVYNETNTARYPDTFIDVLGYELAAKLAGPIRKGDRRDEMLKAAALALVTAAGIDSNVDNRERRKRMEYKPPWIEGRE